MMCFGQVTPDEQTESNAYMSSPCIRTGALKHWLTGIPSWEIDFILVIYMSKRTITETYLFLI